MQAVSTIAACWSLSGVGYRSGKIINAPTEHDTLEIVGTENLERELNLVRAAAAGSLSFMFGHLAS
jgi:hypothetical protein